MERQDSKWSDDKIENIMGNLLRIGVVVSAIVVLIGGVFYLINHGVEYPHYSVFQGEPSDLRTILGIIWFIYEGKARGIIQLGLILLIATPIARVVFSVFAFVLKRDYMYVLITLIVLSVLFYSLLYGTFL